MTIILTGDMTPEEVNEKLLSASNHLREKGIAELGKLKVKRQQLRNALKGQFKLGGLTPLGLQCKWR